MEQLLDTGTQVLWERVPPQLRQHIAKRLRQNLEQGWDDLVEELAAHASGWLNFRQWRQQQWEIAPGRMQLYKEILAWHRRVFVIWGVEALVLGVLLLELPLGLVGRWLLLCFAAGLPWMTARWVWGDVFYQNEQEIDRLRTWVVQELLATATMWRALNLEASQPLGRLLDQFVQQTVVFDAWINWWPGWKQGEILGIIRGNLRRCLASLLENAFASAGWSAAWQKQVVRYLPENSVCVAALGGEEGLGGLLAPSQGVVFLPLAALLAWLLANSPFFR